MSGLRRIAACALLLTALDGCFLFRGGGGTPIVDAGSTSDSGHPAHADSGMSNCGGACQPCCSGNACNFGLSCDDQICVQLEGDNGTTLVQMCDAGSPIDGGEDGGASDGGNDAGQPVDAGGPVDAGPGLPSDGGGCGPGFVVSAGMCEDACLVNHGGCPSGTRCEHAYPSNDVECMNPDAGMPPDAGPLDAGPSDAGGACSTQTCGDGTCSIYGGIAACTCPAGEVFNGATCVANQCDSTTCQANATCSQWQSGPICQCNAGYMDVGGVCQFIGKVAAGPGATCAIYPDNTLWCWGGPTDATPAGGSASPWVPNQLGAGTYSDVSVDGNSDSSFWTLCAIATDGSLWCSGYDPLGIVMPNNGMLQRIGSDNDWKTISVGVVFACGLKVDGSAYCWGTDSHGELGDGTAGTGLTALPIPIAAGDTWLAISAGNEFGCGLKADASLWCWGLVPSFESGTLGQIAGMTSVWPGQSWSTIAAGNAWCGIKTDGELWCRQAGSPTLIPELPGTRWTAVSMRTNEYGSQIGPETGFCAIRGDGTLWCSGGDQLGEAGNGNTDAALLPLTQVGQSDGWISVSARGRQSCAIDSAEGLWCWGDNTMGYVGDGLHGTDQVYAPVQVGSDSDWATVAQGGASEHVCALKQDGTLWCWGENRFGEVGDGSNLIDSNGDWGEADKSVPTQEFTHGSWSQVAVGDESTCAIDMSGTLWCWGVVPGGTHTLVPEIFSTAPFPWTSLCDAFSWACAIRSDGTAWCWGQGGGGGPVDNNYYSAPVQIGTASDWRSLTCGVSYTCGIKTGGSLWCWGPPGAPLGYTPMARSEPPAQVGTDTNWDTVSASGTGVAFGLKTDHTLWSWTTSPPTQVGTVTNWVALSASDDFGACGIQTDGSLWCTGSLLEPNFVQMPSTIPWTSVGVGLRSACATKMDGTLWCWGDNVYGEVGNGAPWIAAPQLIHHP